uniref:DDE Tnp4 domain-containing protein n=1 Tax=Cyprinus carpio carpio TaxID=630221 RepID=A0A9J7Y9A5_CYPCA
MLLSMGTDSTAISNVLGEKPYRPEHLDDLLAQCDIDAASEITYYIVSPTIYCHLNAAVPILRLYFEDGADLRPRLQLSRQSIQSLIAAVKPECDHGWEKDVEVLVFVYWLAHAASYWVVSLAFNIPKSTVHDIVHRMSKAVIGILRQLIAFHSADDLEAVGAGFAQLAGSPAFRVVAGAIDGCHICIKPPASDVQCYFNRKLFNSVQLQAITDHQGKFLDIFVGYPGSVHDARVLKNSPVYTGRLFPPAGKCILGDALKGTYIELF